MRVLLVGSSGGHLTHLMRLEPWWRKHERRWVTFELPDAVDKLQGEATVWAAYPTTRNLTNLVKNVGIAWRVLRQYRPDLIVSTGAGVAAPFFWWGRLLGITTVYLEVFDRIDTPTLTARLCRPFTDLFLVQWEEQQLMHRDATLLGPLW